MTRDMDEVRWEFWKRKANEADRRLRDLNVQLYTARDEAKKPHATARDVLAKLGAPSEIYLDEVRSEGWEECKARPVERNPYKRVKIGHDK